MSLSERGIKATFLGTTQKDLTVTSQLAQGVMDVVFVTVERFYAGGRVDPLFTRMTSDGKIGLIAIDEAHFIVSWKTFRYFIVAIPLDYAINIKLRKHFISQARLCTAKSIVQ